MGWDLWISWHLQELRKKDEELEKEMADLKSKLEELEQLAKSRGLSGLFQVKQQPGTKGKPAEKSPADTSSSSS